MRVPVKRTALSYTFDEKIGPYADAIRAVGIEPVLFKTGSAPPDLSNVEGLVLTGGTDVDPALYGQAAHPETQEPDRARDEMESRLIREALDRDLPVLAICRGLQILNVVCGGTLLQHICGHEFTGTDKSAATHEAVLDQGSRLRDLYGATELAVNSRHHQAIDRPGSGLMITGRAKQDGIAEGMEDPQKRFVLGVQWHPEDQFRRYPEQKRLFDAFADAL